MACLASWLSPQTFNLSITGSNPVHASMKSYILKTEDTKIGVKVSLLSGDESSVWTYVTDGVSSYKDFPSNIEILQKVVSGLVKRILIQDELISEK